MNDISYFSMLVDISALEDKQVIKCVYLYVFLFSIAVNSCDVTL